ncbi:MAG: hypothetical protein ACE5F6_16980 [Anaerolineae bacterium]
MNRRYSSAYTGAWEVPVDDEPSMRHYVSITPAGVALGDLVAIVSYTAVGGLILALVAILTLVGLVDWEFWRAWRWGLALGLVPPAIVGLLFLRLIVALVNAALERILGRDLDDSGDVGDVPPTEVRLIPINRSEKLIEGVDPRDLRYFVEMQEHRGSGQKSWRGVPLPSGRRCDDRYHTKMIQALERARVWEGRGPRTAGKLQGEIEQVIGLLGLDS